MQPSAERTSFPHEGLLFCTSELERDLIAPSTDEELAKLFQTDRAQCLVVCGGDLKVIEPGGGVWFPTKALPPECAAGIKVFLASVDGEPRFAMILPQTSFEKGDVPFGRSRHDGFVNLFRAAANLSQLEAAISAIAVHLAHWIDNSVYCGTCSAPLRQDSVGRKRVCTNPRCGREEFPRIDPVILVLVSSGEHCVLARQRSFPPRFYAPLAGFLGPGETLEQAVRREAWEEVGLRLSAIAHVGSQPWPFPRSVMVGYFAKSEATELVVDSAELEDARWLSKDEVTEACQGKGAADILLPPRGVLGRRLIDSWLSA